MTDIVTPPAINSVLKQFTPSVPSYVIEVQNLQKRYPGRREPALDDLNFAVSTGQVLGLVGANGAGKTSLLKIIATLLPLSAGDVLVKGISIRKNSQAVRRLIGYMPDDFGLYEEMRVSEYLEYFAACYNIQGKQRSRLVTELLQLVDLGERRKEPLRGLSRGMKQRLGLARCLVNDPVALLLDEPANGLDPRARVELRELLRELSRMGKTILLSSNILLDLQDTCDTLAVMKNGRLTAYGPTNEIANQGQAHKKRNLSLRVIEISDLNRAYAAALNFPWVVADSLEADEAGCRLEMTIDGDERTCAALLAHLTGIGVNITYFGQTAVRLEELFLEG